LITSQEVHTPQNRVCTPVLVTRLCTSCNVVEQPGKPRKPVFSDISRTNQIFTCHIKREPCGRQIFVCLFISPPLPGGPAPPHPPSPCLFKTNSQKSVCTKRHCFGANKYTRDLPPKKRTETLRILKSPCATWEPRNLWGAVF
jgi:hypothetical protein